jgi:hypothetical protein
MAATASSHHSSAHISNGPRHAGLTAIAAADRALAAGAAPGAAATHAPGPADAPQPAATYPEPPSTMSASAAKAFRRLLTARPADQWNGADLYVLELAALAYEDAETERDLADPHDPDCSHMKLHFKFINAALNYSRALRLHAPQKPGPKPRASEVYIEETRRLLNAEDDLG